MWSEYIIIPFPIVIHPRRRRYKIYITRGVLSEGNRREKTERREEWVAAGGGGRWFAGSSTDIGAKLRAPQGRRALIAAASWAAESREPPCQLDGPASRSLYASLKIGSCESRLHRSRVLAECVLRRQFHGSVRRSFVTTRVRTSVTYLCRCSINCNSRVRCPSWSLLLLLFGGDIRADEKEKTSPPWVIGDLVCYRASVWPELDVNDVKGAEEWTLSQSSGHATGLPPNDFCQRKRWVYVIRLLHAFVYIRNLAMKLWRIT